MSNEEYISDPPEVTPQEKMEERAAITLGFWVLVFVAAIYVIYQFITGNSSVVMF